MPVERRPPRSSRMDARDEQIAQFAREAGYRITERIGSGGMGIVYRAYDADGRDVAMKLLRHEISDDPRARTRLEREVAAQRRLQHDGVARVLDAELDADHAFVVTEFIPGPTLDDAVSRYGALHPELVREIGLVLGETLQEVHRAGVIHRDLKPSNILLRGAIPSDFDGFDPEGDGLDPVIIDFGIALAADASRMTSTGLVMGTAAYMDPEVIRTDVATEAGDWWSLAAVLAFAATGRAPFGSGRADTVFFRADRGELDLAGLPVDLAVLLRDALRARPEDRPEGREILERLASADVATMGPLPYDDSSMAAGATADEGRTDGERRDEGRADGDSHPRSTRGAARGVDVAGAGATAPMPAGASLAEGADMVPWYEEDRTEALPVYQEDRTEALPVYHEDRTEALPRHTEYPTAVMPAIRDVPAREGQDWRGTVPSGYGSPARPAQPLTYPAQASPAEGFHQSPVPYTGYQGNAAYQSHVVHGYPDHAYPDRAYPQPAPSALEGMTPQQLALYAPPPRRPLAVWLGHAWLVGLAAVAPFIAVSFFLGFGTLARTWERLHRTVAVRRARGGGGTGAAIASSPFRVLQSFLEIVLLSVLPLTLGLVVAVGADAVAYLMGILAPESGLFALAMAIGLLLTWIGPGGTTLRHGAHRAVAAATPDGLWRAIIVGLLILVLVATAMAITARGGSADYIPFFNLPRLVSLLPWRP